MTAAAAAAATAGCLPQQHLYKHMTAADAAAAKSTTHSHTNPQKP
jgi:hypothetical protein